MSSQTSVLRPKHKRSSSSRISTVRRHDPSTTSYGSDAQFLNPNTSRPPTRHRTVGMASTARPRTGISTLGVENQEIVCAVSESRGVATIVGLAFINLDTGEAVLCQISDSQTFVRTIHKITVFNPSIILIVSTAIDPKTKLFAIIEDSLDELNCQITLIDRRYFTESAGFDSIERLAFTDDVDSIKTSVSGNYYAICCFAAALKFIELGLAKTFQSGSLRIKYEPSEGTMMIDLATIKSLELMQNLNNPKSKDCLFGLLNNTLTPMGARLLRSSVLQPSTDICTLDCRYEAVEELSTKEEMFFALRSALKSSLDIDKILTQLILVHQQPSFEHIEQAINNVIMLKHFVEFVGPIHNALSGSRSTILLRIREMCAPVNFQAVQESINNVLHADTTYARKPLDLRNQRTYAVRSGVNGLLDVARQTYKESMNDALTHITAIAEEYHITLKTKYNNSRQFYLMLYAAELESRNLPAVFINVHRRRNVVECQTLELLKCNQKINDSHNEVLLMSNNAVQGLIRELRPHMPALFRICEAVALLDMLSSFAFAVTSNDYARPHVNADADAFAIHAARHPIREQIQATKFIPNDIYATPQTRFQIITGCNMSGKTTYIRTVALIAVMAQVGSFVPAAYAAISPAHQLFARIAPDAGDAHVEANASTFAAEMREAAFILRNVDGAHSLVLVDELGRGTATRDGLAIAIAIAEALIQSRARVWFATHFRDLALVLAERPGVVNLHLAARVTAEAAMGNEDERGERLEMFYRVTPGAVMASHYGLRLARLMPLPRDVITHAETVSRTLEQRMQNRKGPSLAIITARRRKLLLNLKESILQAHRGSMNDQALGEWLRGLQRQFVLDMTTLDQETEAIVAAEDATLSNIESSQVHTQGPPEPDRACPPCDNDRDNREVDIISIDSGPHSSSSDIDL